MNLTIPNIAATCLVLLAVMTLMAVEAFVQVGAAANEISDADLDALFVQVATL